MSNLFVDSTLDDAARRERLYDGDLFVFSPCASALALAEFGQDLVKQAFAPHDPRDAQQHMEVERYAAILAELKPRFIHHPECKRLIQGILSDLGCDLEKTYFDVPRMRTATSDGYLTSGIAYAFHPHRDTWYSAPFCQLNWWFPMYPIQPDNAMAFHPRYWTEPLRNSSRIYNYYRWNAESRKQAAMHVKSDTRPQPRPEEPVALDPQLRVIAPVGGMLIFSAAQLHSTVPNTSGFTRFSIDFRTVHIDDVAARYGALNIDSACTGTTMRDYLRGSDLAHVPDDLVALYDDDSTSEGELVYPARVVTPAA
jgi:hypothetical protein